METENQNNRSNIFEGVNAYQKEELNKVIKNARISLFIISGFSLVFAFAMYFMDPDKEDAIFELIAEVIISAIFAVLGFLSNKKPYFALLTGLIIYSLLIVANTIVEPTSLFKGIILKAAIITWLVKGIIGARRIKNLIEA